MDFVPLSICVSCAIKAFSSLTGGSHHELGRRTRARDEVFSCVFLCDPGSCPCFLEAEGGDHCVEHVTTLLGGQGLKETLGEVNTDFCFVVA